MGKILRVEIDGESGFCFGVVNAISKAEEALAGGEVFSLGDIVHNRLEVQRLGERGLRSVSHGELEPLRGKTLLIRAHGEPPATYEKAAALGMDVIDATCPVVAALQRIAARAWQEMKPQGGQVVIFGKRGHAEVAGLAGHTEGRAIVIEGKEDLDAIDFSKPVFFLSQTTQSLALFRELSEEIRNRAENPARVTVRDTICRRVSDREAHLREFSQGFDVVLFVAGRKSSNGKVLFEVCRAANPRSHHIEESGEIDPAWFEDASCVGVCGATSTPQWLMEEVAAAVTDME